ncbi:MAG: pseudouridine synthase [Patescibacteria group bacterium]
MKKKAAPKKPAPPAKETTYPMRINQYLAKKGHATRRGADELIEKGFVFVNGVKAKIGDKVAESDTVEVKIKRPRTYVYLAFHKPKGMDTHKEPTSTSDVVTSLPDDLRRLKLFPIGRLDKASRGLLLLTNDGRVTDRLLNPEQEHEKVYEVTTKKPLRESFKEKMEQGVDIEGYVTKPAKVTILSENKFRIALTEGKSHQVRRMVVALFNEVSDLKRTRIGNIAIEPLKPGAYRRLSGKELATFLESLGLS